MLLDIHTILVCYIHRSNRRFIFLHISFISLLLYLTQCCCILPASRLSLVPPASQYLPQCYPYWSDTDWGHTDVSQVLFILIHLTCKTTLLSNRFWIFYSLNSQFVLLNAVCLNRLKQMCRKPSDQTFIYKPLGVLKRTTVERPTYGETNTPAHYHSRCHHVEYDI